jgi:hypothetical protein
MFLVYAAHRTIGCIANIAGKITILIVGYFYISIENVGTALQAVIGKTGQTCFSANSICTCCNTIINSAAFGSARAAVMNIFLEVYAEQSIVRTLNEAGFTFVRTNFRFALAIGFRTNRQRIAQRHWALCSVSPLTVRVAHKILPAVTQHLTEFAILGDAVAVFENIILFAADSHTFPVAGTGHFGNIREEGRAAHAPGVTAILNAIFFA